MRTFSRIAAAVMTVIIALSASMPTAAADTSLEETKKLLQKGLTIHEIDEEVSRLSEQEGAVSRQIDLNLRSIADYGKKAAVNRVHAGKVLNAYYTGERDSLWLLIFHAKSFQDMMAVYDYLSVILDNDKKTLKQYSSDVKKLTELNAELGRTRTEYEQVKEAFLTQKHRLLAMQNELDEQLIGKDDAETIKQQIEGLNTAWEQKGLPLFKTYLQATADAMKQLPDYIADHQDSLTMNGFNYTLTINDTDLNKFLRGKNRIFNQVSFVFDNNKLLISGKQDDSDLRMEGHYVLEEKPQNALRFIIDGLSYNGFELPDTTMKELEKQFDLSIYPKQTASFLIATGVSIDPGKLKVNLTFDLSQ